MISYIHKVHPLSRSVKLKVEADGQLYVITPKRFSSNMIESFILQNTAWIQQMQQKIKTLKVHQNNDDSVNVFGKKYAKVLTTDTSAKLGVQLKGNQALIKLPSGQKPTKTAQETVINRFIKATAEKYIVPRTHQLAEIMQVTFGRITMREQKSRWGSCSSHGNLNFNWRLVHYPTAIIDYVIIHELAHRQEMNHSAAFWSIVRRYDPAFLQHRGWLKRHGLGVG